MRKTNVSHLLLLILLIAAAACAPTPASTALPPTPALTLYISTTGNDANDCLSEATACLTLYNTLRRSTPGSTVHIGPGEFLGTRAAEVRHALTIIGAGRDLTFVRDGFSIGGIWLVTIRDLTVDLRGIALSGRGILALENCRISDTPLGIAVFSESSTTIRNCLIENNVSGISVERGADLTIIDTTLQGNTTALGNGGTTRITNSTFQSNGSEREDGGRSHNIYNVGDLTITSSTITRNDGINFAIQDGQVILDRVRVTENRSSGIDVGVGGLIVRYSLIQNNSGYGIAVGNLYPDPDVGAVDISESAIVGNVKSGLEIDDGNVYVRNTTISGNNTEGFSTAGGIRQYLGGNLVLADSTVAYNSGYGIYAQGPAMVLTMRRSVVALNSGDECFIPSDASRSTDTIQFTCVEGWTTATLGLGPLTEEAGTFVHPLLPDSPLIDAVSPARGGTSVYCPPNDQRGLVRPVGVTCDFGAYESGATLAAILSEPGTPGLPDILPIYTDTPAPSPVILTLTKNAFCRKGPGIRYFDVTGFEPGITVEAKGRNEGDPRWWWVMIPNSSDHCWVSGSTVETNDPADQLPVQPALELPEDPEDFGITARSCSPNGYSLALGWSETADEEGYYLYRNGEQQATIRADKTSYKDEPPMNVSFLYELEAFNENGTSERLAVEEEGCP